MSEAAVSAPNSTYLNHEKGIMSWLTTTDHKRIGLMYLWSIGVAFLLGGVSALLVRLELFDAGPSQILGEGLSKPDLYNWWFTMHGALMIFVVIVPGIPATLGNFIMPLMIGAKDVMFPRMNLLTLYLYWGGAAFALVALLAGHVDTGWTMYTPYSVTTKTPTIPIIFGVFVMGFSSILTGLNFIVTIHKMRCPGMGWMQLPVFVWAIYAAAVIQVLATPVVGITLLLLIMEKCFEIGFFDPQFGGNPILFQHFFWFYSHPVVYIMILPAMGVVADIIPVFSRKPIFGYKGLVIASVAIAAVSFFVWGHHLFTNGMSDWSRYIFSFLTFFVAIPTAVKVYNWTFTLYKGSITLTTPMIWSLFFVFLFSIAGLTGVYLAVLSIDVQLHDTYFVVAHFHYTIQGGAIVMLMAGVHYWFPLMTGRMYSEGFGKFCAFLFFIGFNGTFLPQFLLGLQGMPRRYYDYLPEFEGLHRMSSVFALILGVSFVIAILHLFYMAFKGKPTERNPWKSLSVEWMAPHPPLPLNFSETPVLKGTIYDYGTKA